jgi:hypothetical protein
MSAALALGDALGVPPLAMAELLPVIEAVMVAKLNEQMGSLPMAEKMGWMPHSPNGIAMCQACDVKAQDRTGDGIHGRSYHHRD